MRKPAYDLLARASRLVTSFRLRFFPELEIAILKVDPSPAPANDDVSLVCQLTSFVNDNARIRVFGTTDEGVSTDHRYVSLDPRATAIVTLVTVWKTAGQHSVHVEASRVRTVQVIVPPDGPVATETIYDPPVTDRRDVAVYAPGMRTDIPIVKNVGPNRANGVTQPGDSTAGVIQAVFGNEACLFAVSKTAGVWRSLNGAPWTQLGGSPPNAFCAAIDPGDSKHIVVGEREGRARDARLNACGLWESKDGGDTWTFVWDPFPDTGSHLIRAIEFDPATRTLFIGTEDGVAIRPYGYGNPVGLPRSTTNTGAITALAAGDGQMWARTVDDLMFSTTDGLTWQSIPIARTIDIPGVGNGFDVVLDGRSDPTSLAAFGNTVLVVFTPRVPDPTCDPGNPQFDAMRTDCDPLANRCAVLVLDVAAQKWHAEVLGDGNGTGSGGRRFVRLFRLRNCQGSRSVIGDRLRLFYGSGSGIQEALGFDPSTNTFAWDPIVTRATTHQFHPDIWDFHLSDAFCPTSARFGAWIACDGGVFGSTYEVQDGEAPPLLPLGRTAGFQWVTMNDGLHTHNIHTVTVLQSYVDSSTLLAYSTSDNDAWFRRADGSWISPGLVGDANYTIGDVGDPAVAVVGRDLGNYFSPSSVLATFGSDAAGGMPVQQFHVDFNAVGSPPTNFQAVQTLWDEQLATNLDVVLLTRLPLTDSLGNALPGAPTLSGGQPLVLMRNSEFRNHPDGPSSNFQDWLIAVPDVPTGATRVWPTGGRTNTVYYFFASNRTCAAGLFKREQSQPSWSSKCVIDGLLDGGNSTYGAAFVSPFDPLFLFVVVTDPQHPNGIIKMSTNGGQTFTDDEILTALVSASGKYALGEIEPGDTLLMAGSASHNNITSTLAYIAFSRESLREVVAISPITGAFYRNFAKGCFGSASQSGFDQSWKTLTPYLPSPLPIAVSAGLDAQGVYIGTEGRGLLFVSNPQYGAPATFFVANPAPVFQFSNDGDATVLFGSLKDATGGAVALGLVRVTWREVEGVHGYGRDARESYVRTDAQGSVSVVLPVGELSSWNPTLIVRLRFVGDGTLSPCETSFFSTIALS